MTGRMRLSVGDAGGTPDYADNMPNTGRKALKKPPLTAIVICGGVVMLVYTVLVHGFIYASAQAGAFDGVEMTTTVVDGDYINFEMEAPNTAMRRSSIVTEDDCTAAYYSMNNFRLFVAAYEKECDVPDDQVIQNGNHGLYKTLDDVPDPIKVEEVDTAVGPAQIFTQKYSEYTNSSNHYEEPVAIVTFDKPVNPDFPTMIISSAKGEMSRADFTSVVKNLRPHV